MGEKRAVCPRGICHHHGAGPDGIHHARRKSPSTSYRKIEGYPTGRDVISALDSSTAGPTYRAGILRQAAMKRLEALEAKHKSRARSPSRCSAPPRLTKLLYEAHPLVAALPLGAEPGERRPVQARRRSRGAAVERAVAPRRDHFGGHPEFCTWTGARLTRGPDVVVPPAQGDPLAAGAARLGGPAGGELARCGSSGPSWVVKQAGEYAAKVARHRQRRRVVRHRAGRYHRAVAHGRMDFPARGTGRTHQALTMRKIQILPRCGRQPDRRRRSRRAAPRRSSRNSSKTRSTPALKPLAIEIEQGGKDAHPHRR